MSKVAIVAALEREVKPLVKSWRVSESEHAGRSFRFFENEDEVVVCAGIGAEAARRAAEAVIALYEPSTLYSVGFAGALESGLRVAEIVQPRRVVNAGDGSSVSLAYGDGVLVSFASVAGADQKMKLRDSFGAQAVDMEAASVARAAELRGVRFGVVKVISDEVNFTFLSMARFVNSDGKFLEAQFAMYACLRPWLWPKVAAMARNTKRASVALCDCLRNMLKSVNTSETSSPVVRSAGQPVEAATRR